MCLGSLASLEQQLAFEPIELRLVAPLPRAVHQRQRLVQHLLAFVTLARLPVCPGQKGQRVWLSGLCPGRPVCRQALPYLPHALLLSSLLDQYPTPAEHPARQLERKSLRGRQGDERVCPLASDLHLPAHEREYGGIVEDLRQGKRVRQLLRPGQRCIEVLPRLLGIAQMPQGSGRNAVPHRLRILHGIGDMRMVRLWIVER